MKYEITAEFLASGVRSARVIDVPLGVDMLDAFLSERSLEPEEWRLDGVVAIGEPDEPIPADHRFPDLPTHPDFARMSAAAIEVDRRSDESDDSVLPPEIIGIDGDTLAYMAGQRIGRAYEHPLVQLMPRTIQLQGAWCDGFAVGVEYQKRGGSREVAE